MVDAIYGMAVEEKSAVLFGSNPVQPSPLIHAAVAFALLRTLHCETPVSDVELDAGTGRLITATRCAVSAVTVQSNMLQFIRADHALPTWLDPEARSVYRYLPLANAMNYYGLTVHGLAAGDWQLSVAGTNVAVFSAAQLAAGVNLAALSGPWQAVGAKINSLSADAEAFYHHIWWDVKTMWWLPVEAEAERQRLLDRVSQVLSAREEARSRAAVNIPPWVWRLTKNSDIRGI